MPIPSFDHADQLSVTDVRKLISDRVRFERRRLGLSQENFAQQTGIALRTYKRLELGECDSIDALIKVAQMLGRASGFSSLFPQLLPTPIGRLNIALQSIRAKMDARVVNGEGILDDAVPPERK